MRAHRSLRSVPRLSTLFAFVAACSAPRGAPDVAVESDASSPDAPALDALTTDAPALDAPAPDASQSDALTPDARPDGSPADASLPDAPACATAGFSRCGDRCVDLAGDPSHCGACDRSCRAGTNATAECIAGECDRGCARGFGDCDGNTANGCETSLDLAASCGACGVRCAAGMLCVSAACRSADATAPPRMIAPLSGVRLGTRMPALAWALAPGVSGAEVQVCRDRRCDDVAYTAPFEAARARVVDALPRGGYFWRVRSRVGGVSVGAWSSPWWFRVTGRETSATVGWGSVPDFNGDGYADLVVSSGKSRENAGELRLYYGGPAGLARAVGWVGTAPDAPGNGLGCSIGAADLTGDGLLEVLAGGNDSGTLAGRVHAFEGTPDGPRAAAIWSLAGGPLLSALGDHVRGGADFDGDGYGDVLVSASAAGGTLFPGAVLVYPGRARGAPSVASVVLRFADEVRDRRFGLGSAVAGDINGDGFIDVAGAASDRTDEPGRVGVFLGSPTGLQTVVSATLQAPGGGSAGDRFGEHITGAGDVNGDGFGDLLIAAPGLDSGRGGAWLYLGSASGLLAAPVWEVRGATPGAQVGRDVAGGGDVDGDGFDDVVLVSGNETTGTARVYYGGGTGIRAMSSVLERTAGAPLVGVERAAIIGDTNGDGFDEVALGAPSANRLTGAAYVFRGSAVGIAALPSWENTGERATDEFGRAIAY